jgi:hypothetical protein
MLLNSQASIAQRTTIEYQCPIRIMTTQSSVSPLPEWHQSTERPFTTNDERFKNNSENYLATVLFYEGAPEGRGALISDNEEKANAKVWDAEWSFSSSEKIWLVCQYRQTTVMLSKQLPNGIKRCFVRFDRIKGNTVQKVWCEK